MGLKRVVSRVLATYSLCGLRLIISLSVPQFPHLHHWNNANAFLIDLL